MRADAWWKYFEMTGSIEAYLIYIGIRNSNSLEGTSGKPGINTLTNTFN
jgi:hypothetical protein